MAVRAITSASLSSVFASPGNSDDAASPGNSDDALLAAMPGR